MMQDVDKVATTLDQWLQAANGDRQSIMSRETVALLLRLVIDGDQLAWARSHFTTQGFAGHGSATVALCVRIDPKELCIAVARGAAQKTSPGRTWSELKPWRP
jgi:hypothetical protein